MMPCWQLDPDDRPDASRITMAIAGMFSGANGEDYMYDEDVTPDDQYMNHGFA